MEEIKINKNRKREGFTFANINLLGYALRERVELLAYS